MARTLPKRLKTRFVRAGPMPLQHSHLNWKKTKLVGWGGVGWSGEVEVEVEVGVEGLLMVFMIVAVS